MAVDANNKSGVRAKISARTVLALTAGKCARFLSRLRGRGSAFPGYLANKIAPNLLDQLGSQFDQGIVYVLGSNGKTTTTHMISSLLREQGLRVFTNPTGANLPQGVTSALLADVSIFGKIQADIAVLEIDEGFAVELAKSLTPRVVVALNVQVDQLYRFYETERVADMMLDTGEFATELFVVNRDDPYLSKVDLRKNKAEVTFFGASEEVIKTSPNGLVNAKDTRSGNSESHRHEASVEVLSQNGREVTLGLGSGSIELTLPAAGLHYAVDAAAAVEVARFITGDSFSAAAVSKAFREMAPAYGRGELLPLRNDASGEQVEFVMFKNAPSLQLNVDALLEAPERVLLAIDEGTPDISWLYDVDLSKLQKVDVVTGEKAYQIATRLAYAGIPIGSVEPDLAKAVELMRAFEPSRSNKQTWFVNYEIMMISRRLLGHGDQEIARV